MNSNASPVVQHYRLRPTTLNGGAALVVSTDYPFAMSSGTFEVRVVIGSDGPGGIIAFSFYMQGNYGFNMNEGQRCYLQHTGGDRACVIDTNPANTYSGLMSQVTLTSTTIGGSRAWVFKFPSGNASIPTVSQVAGPAASNVVVTVMDMTRHGMWW